MKPLAERTTVQSTLARAEALLRSARLLFYQTLTDTWLHTLNVGSATLEQRADLLLAGVHAVKNAVEVTDLMHSLAGTSAIYQKSRLERHFRDAHTLRHHGFVSESKIETVESDISGPAARIRNDSILIVRCRARARGRSSAGAHWWARYALLAGAPSA